MKRRTPIAKTSNRQGLKSNTPPHNVGLQKKHVTTIIKNTENGVIDISILRKSLSSVAFIKKINGLSAYREGVSPNVDMPNGTILIHFDRQTYQDAFTRADKNVDMAILEEIGL